MAAVPNKKIAAANGAKTARAIREDQVAPTATPGRIGSINFDQFNGPTAAAIVNEVAPPVVAPIEPPGVERALAAGARVVKRNSAKAREAEVLARYDSTPRESIPLPDFEQLPDWLLTTSEMKQRNSQKAQSQQPNSSASSANPRVLSPLEAARQIIREQDQSEGLLIGERAVRENQVSRQSQLNPMQRSIASQLSQTEIGRSVAEQVQQGTPLTEVVSSTPANRLTDLQDRFQDLVNTNGGTRNPTPEMIQISREADRLNAQQRASRRRADTSTDTSAYATPGTPQAEQAARVAAASGGMGAAGGGEGGGGGGRVPPPRNPNDFDPDRPDRPSPPVPPSARIAGGTQLQPGLFNHLKAGWRAQAGDKNYADSVVGDTFRRREFPEQADSSIGDKAAYLGGRIGADLVGYGTRKGFWNMNPEDALGTLTREGANWAGLNGREAQLARYATAATVGLVGANYNPLNIGEGGRPIGFSAVNPTDDDARKTDNPIGELLFDRAMLGRTGRLLPWEEFHQERPDVPYEKYAKYQDYIRGPSFMGLAKGTTDGIDGPEARVVGYRVQPEAVLAAAAAGAATIAAFKYGGRRL